MLLIRRKAFAWATQIIPKHHNGTHTITFKSGHILYQLNNSYDVGGSRRSFFVTSSSLRGIHSKVENLNAAAEKTHVAETEKTLAAGTEKNLAAGTEANVTAETEENRAGGTAENSQSFSSGKLLETELLKCDNIQASLESKATEDDVSKIREEFDAVRQSFQNIPAALRMMPKMDPCGIYANDNLRLDHIEVYGFDYDYTVSHYTGSLQTLIYDLAKEHIVKENRYPESCLQFQYDPNFPIRGLFYDKKRGCLLKLDFFHCIEPDGCYYGRRKMSTEEVEEIYGNRHISRDYATNLTGLMDLFCFSEACLISDIIQHFVDQKLDFDAFYVYEDVKRAIHHVHCSGLVHKKILAEPGKYLVKNAAVLKFLRTLRERGKKLFLLTNSPFYFVDGGMRFMFEELGVKGDSWQDLFDVVIALADKPNFYMSDRPFRYYDKEKDILTFSKVDAFEPHKIYYHGCLKSFLEITKWKGNEVMYFGDHLFSDLRGPAKAGWRTAAIIRELEAKFHIAQELLGKFHSLLTKNPRGDADNVLLDALNEERKKSRWAMKEMFNPYFGAAFLTDSGRESAFAYNIQRYADVYTSKLENFLNYSSEAWLHTPYDVKIMPHHVKIPSSVLKTKTEWNN
ncbi:uncharacterized protein LOC131063905 isoform X3 [Cryptomeria japonica]|uniref:uncharacterized protein LOC131063905 isoform X3 n=1 Tax=Cryptomeria japonica TaxID=3369 RepID=UPI0025AC1799|nr:uncharacterized protein LOC131063905 isoform X3 [Cryptomeria japonica]